MTESSLTDEGFDMSQHEQCGITLPMILPVPSHELITIERIGLFFGVALDWFAVHLGCLCHAYYTCMHP